MSSTTRRFRVARKRTNLGSQSLEESTSSLLLDHLSDNGHSSNRVLEVGLLDSSLDDIKRSSNGDGSDGSSDGGDEVLGEGSLRVVGEVEEELLGHGRSSEELVDVAEIDDRVSHGRFELRKRGEGE